MQSFFRSGSQGFGHSGAQAGGDGRGRGEDLLTRDGAGQMCPVPLDQLQGPLLGFGVLVGEGVGRGREQGVGCGGVAGDHCVQQFQLSSDQILLRPGEHRSRHVGQVMRRQGAGQGELGEDGLGVDGDGLERVGGQGPPVGDTAGVLLGGQTEVEQQPVEHPLLHCRTAAQQPAQTSLEHGGAVERAFRGEPRESEKPGVVLVGVTAVQRLAGPPAVKRPATMGVR